MGTGLLVLAQGRIEWNAVQLKEEFAVLSVYHAPTNRHSWSEINAAAEILSLSLDDHPCVCVSQLHGMVADERNAFVLIN